MSVDLHLYIAAADALDGLAALAPGCLDSEEQARSGRFIHAADRRLFDAAHVLLRHALSVHADYAPSEWRFERNAHGRPRIAASLRGASGWSFNLSHTRGLACCVVGRCVELGVDVECPRRVRDVDAIARRFFSPAEYRDLCAIADPERRYRHFLRLWCLKESYVKARGVGLALGLDGFGFSLDGRRIDVQIGDDADAGRDWRFALLDAGGGCPIALAVRPSGGGTAMVRMRGVAATRVSLPAAPVVLGSSDKIKLSPSPALLLSGTGRVPTAAKTG